MLWKLCRIWCRLVIWGSCSGCGSETWCDATWGSLNRVSMKTEFQRVDSMEGLSYWFAWLNKCFVYIYLYCVAFINVTVCLICCPATILTDCKQGLQPLQRSYVLENTLLIYTHTDILLERLEVLHLLDLVNRPTSHAQSWLTVHVHYIKTQSWV